MGNYDWIKHRRWCCIVIPLREKMGNYDLPWCFYCSCLVIPLREKMGNYDSVKKGGSGVWVIPLREKMGNYDWASGGTLSVNVIPLREKMGNNDNVSAPNIPWWFHRILYPHLPFSSIPKWRETFLTKIVPGNGCSLPWVPLAGTYKDDPRDAICILIHKTEAVFSWHWPPAAL